MTAGWILRLACLIALLLPSLVVHASILTSRLRTEEGLLRSPPGDLAYEFAQIAPTTDRPKFKAVLPDRGMSVWEHSLKVDVSEMTEALKADGLTDDESKLALAYTTARQQISTYAEVVGSIYSPTRTPSEKPPTATVPDGLPEEFALYLGGALDYHNGRLDAAREKWLKLLELPPERRRHRSVWAAFMLGRCKPETVGDEWSIGWFERCRELAAEQAAAPRHDEPVYTDRLGLAAASYGWEAKLKFDAGNDAAAIDLYLTQLACGDTRSADSLAHVAQSVFANGGALIESPAAVSVLAAFAGCDGGPHRAAPRAEFVRKWVSSLFSSKQDLRVSAGNLAWAGYAAGDLDAAAGWAAFAPKSSGRAHWVRSKVLIREDELDAAADALSAAMDAYRKAGASKWDLETALQQTDRSAYFSPVEQCRAELGLVRLAQQQYPSAMAAFVNAGFRDGAEYVAEFALTLDQLKEFRDLAATRRSRGVPSGYDPKASGVSIDSLLARRLIRLNRWDDARPLFDARIQKTIDDYREGLRRGEDTTLYDEERAAGLWRAARAAFGHGYSFFYRSSSRYWRSDANWKHLRAEPDEVHRSATAEREEMSPNYPTAVAGTLAWRAAELLPDEDDETARMLNTAGRWYANSDNARADTFYKALVRRCGTTKVGRDADRRGWFLPG